jgi:hypothetical protein
MCTRTVSENMVDATQDASERNKGFRMKKLNMFSYFDWERFAEKKRFVSTGIQPWKDFESGEVIGTKVEAVIAQDGTSYGNKEGEIISNIYEKLTFKVPKKIDIPMNVEIRPVNVEATVYGDYRNQLSITAEDVEVIGK